MLFTLKTNKRRSLRRQCPWQWRIFQVLAIALTCIDTINAADEGDPCNVNTLRGVCTPGSKCKTLDAAIEGNLITPDDIANCGYTIREEMICCPILPGESVMHKPATITTSTTTTTTTPAPSHAIETTTFDPVAWQAYVQRLSESLADSSTAKPFWEDLITTTTTTTVRPIQIGGKQITEKEEYVDLTKLLASKNNSGGGNSFVQPNPVNTEEPNWMHPNNAHNGVAQPNTVAWPSENDNRQPNVKPQLTQQPSFLEQNLDLIGFNRPPQTVQSQVVPSSVPANMPQQNVNSGGPLIVEPVRPFVPQRPVSPNLPNRPILPANVGNPIMNNGWGRGNGNGRGRGNGNGRFQQQEVFIPGNNGRGRGIGNGRFQQQNFLSQPGPTHEALIASGNDLDNGNGGFQSENFFAPPMQPQQLINPANNGRGRGMGNGRFQQQNFLNQPSPTHEALMASGNDPDNGNNGFQSENVFAPPMQQVTNNGRGREIGNGRFQQQNFLNQPGPTHEALIVPNNDEGNGFRPQNFETQPQEAFFGGVGNGRGRGVGNGRFQQQNFLPQQIQAQQGLIASNNGRGRGIGNGRLQQPNFLQQPLQIPAQNQFNNNAQAFFPQQAAQLPMRQPAHLFPADLTASGSTLNDAIAAVNENLVNAGLEMVEAQLTNYENNWEDAAQKLPFPAELNNSVNEPFPIQAENLNFAQNPWLPNRQESTMPTPPITPIRDNNPSSTTIKPNESRFNQRPAIRACQELESSLPLPITPHILNGVAVDLGEFPHMAAIGFTTINSQREFDFNCGGSLIAPRFVLTAAHCVNSIEREPAVVRLGASNILQPEPSAINIRIQNVHIHPNYTNSQKYDDIALLELEQAAPINEYIQPVCLHTEADLVQTDPVYWVTGWGVINVRNRTTSPRLLKAQLQIVPLSSCNTTFANEGAFTRQLERGIIEKQLCVQDRNLKSDSCQGDSGGPLSLSYGLDNRYRVVGIVSTGFSCGTSVPGLYTRVISYLDYIEQIVWPGNG